MQQVATKVFIYASVVFGVLGIIVVLIAPNSDQKDTGLHLVLVRLLAVSVFVILPSFALSVAGKYLKK